MFAAMIGAKVTVVVIVFSLLYSLHTLKFCLNCSSIAVIKPSVEKCKEDDECYEPRATSISAGFISPSTLHTIGIEGANDDVNCWAACSLGLRHNCSEPGRSECPTILRTPAKSAVAFEDLTEGDYIVTVNCDESEASCYAEPEEFAFPVQLQTPKTEVSLREIPLVNIKLYKKVTGQCSNEQVFRSRLTCLGTLYTLVGAVLLIISLRMRREASNEAISSCFLQDMKWVLQTRCRS